MNYYSQRNPNYKNVKLGTSNYTLYSQGCFCMVLSMLSYKDPVEVNQLLRDNYGYSNQCMVNSKRAAELLGLDYEGKGFIKPEYICGAEVKLYNSQHFVVFAPRGTVSHDQDMILDPWDKPNKIGWKKNTYKVVTYRKFHEKKPVVDSEMIKAIKFCEETGLITVITGQPKTDKELCVILHRLYKKYLK